MASPSVLPTIDVDAAKEQARSSLNQRTGPSGLDRGVDFASYMAGAMGPAISETVYATGGRESANIISAAVNATATNGGYPGYYGGVSAGGVGVAGGANYLTGGSPQYQTVGGTVGGTGLTDMVAQTQANTEALMVVQLQMNNMQTKTSAESNILQARHGALRTIIQNFRVA